MPLLRFVIAAAAAAVFAAPAAAQRAQTLMPGVTYDREVEFTSHGPVVMHVLRAPRPTGLYALKPTLSNETIIGREKVTQMQRRLMTTATVAGVNGDLFSWSEGRPSGMLMLDNVLASPSGGDRSSTGIAADGSLVVSRVRMAGTWRGAGQRRPLTLNRDPAPNGVALYTPRYGPATPVRAGSVELTLQPFPPAQPGRDLAGVVVSAKEGGGTPIPPDGAVLVGRGSGGAGRLAAEAPVGSTVIVRFVLTPDWSQLVDAIGGGPALVREGRPIFRANEVFSLEQLVPRQPRAAVGQTADGRIVLVTVDGRRPGYSVGMTNFELALAMARLGAHTASALDGGGSATMAFEGQLLNRPSDPGGERAIAESLNIHYYGVHVPQLPESVVSPNGDGVGERQTLTYKLVRPSTVSARLVAPDGTEQIVDAGAKPAVGFYRYQWGGPGVEGTWRFVVTATDDLGRTSSAERTFAVNNTLASLRVVTPSIKRRSRLRTAFTLTRPAQVRARVVTPSGSSVVTLQARSLGAGTQSISWPLRLRPGRYQVRITAQNAIGTATLAAPFGVRR